MSTISLDRVMEYEIAGRMHYVTDAEIKRQVRSALSRHLGLDLAPAADGIV